MKALGFHCPRVGSHLAVGTKAAARLTHSPGTPILPVLTYVPLKEPAPPPCHGHFLIPEGTS